MSILLIEVSGAARVRNVYDPQVSLNDSLYYTLIVLPEILQQLLTSWPALLHRCGLADKYAGWRTKSWRWVGRAFPVQTDPEAAAEQASEAADGKGKSGDATLAVPASDSASSCSGDGGSGTMADGSASMQPALPLE